MISGEHILAEETAQRHLEEAREIIERRLITSHFQPIVDLQRGAVIGWET